MKTIFSLLLALLTFTAIPTTQAKADIASTTGTVAVTSQTAGKAAVGHGYYRHRGGYYGRPHWDRGYHRGYYRGYHRGYYRHHNRSGITIRF